MDDEETYIIKLFCYDCEFSSPQLCEYCPYYVPADEKEKYFCTRKVNEELYIDYLNQTKEVWPFAGQLSKEKMVEEYEKTIDIISAVFHSPLGIVRTGEDPNKKLWL